MDLSRTVTEIDCDFSRKSQIFPTPVFCAPAEGIPPELGIGAGIKIVSRCENSVWRLI